jgi:hypothetical protein
LSRRAQEDVLGEDLERVGAGLEAGHEDEDRVGLGGVVEPETRVARLVEVGVGAELGEELRVGDPARRRCPATAAALGMLNVANPTAGGAGQTESAVLMAVVSSSTVTSSSSFWSSVLQRADVSRARR